MLTLSDAYTSILDATHEANNTYLTMSGGASVHDNGVESLIASGIARKLWCAANGRKKIPDRQTNLSGYAVTLESPFFHIAVDSGSQTKGKKNSRFTENERIDVTVWSPAGNPIGIVEVKRYFGFAQAQSDLDRISYLVTRHGSKHGGSVRWGAIAGMRPVWGKNLKSPDQILAEVSKKVKSRYKDFNLKSDLRSERLRKPEKYDGVEFHGYDAYVVLMTRKRA